MLRLNNNKILGVDIGESSVKLIQLDHGKNFCLDKFHIAALSPGLVAEGRVVDQPQVAGIIEGALRQAKISAKEAVTSINFSNVMVKTLRAEKGMSKRELGQWVEQEVDQFVPYPLSELSIDYHIDDLQLDDSADEIVITACRRQIVEEAVACLEMAGLEPHAVDISHHALNRAVIQGLPALAAGESNLSAVMDVGMSGNRFYVFAGHQMIFNRDGALGASALVEAFAQQYELDPKRAHLDIVLAKKPKGFKQNVLKLYLKALFKEVQRGMYAFESSGAPGQIGRVLLAGGSWPAAGIENVLSKKLRVEVKRLNPLLNFKKAGRIDQTLLNKCAPQLAQACGLAMWNRPK